jgi:Flp pilus assembly protein TadB
MTFIFACGSFVRQREVMSTIIRLSLLAATLAALGALWVVTSPLTAVAVGFTIFAYLFVLAMKSAAEEILRFEQEQMPDLYA